MLSNRQVMDREGPSDAKVAGKAEVILIPKHLRMEWTDALALDNGLGHVAFRVACVIGHHLNRHRGDTYVTQERLAELMGLAPRTIQKAVAELEARGWLIVERRELGERSDGRRVCGGRGVANTYRPACDASPVTATAGGRRLAERVEAMKAARPVAKPARRRAERTHGDASSEAEKDAPGCVLSQREWTHGDDGKDAPGCVPTQSSPSGKNPTRAREAARLGPAGERLRRRIGAAAFRAWFGEVEVAGRSGGVVTLAARTAFAADWIAQHYGGALLAAFRAVDPDVERVVVTVPETG